MLLPGEMRVIRGSGVLRTVLGSCVSLCLYDPTTGIGGMNHYMLPDGNSLENPLKYGAKALPALYEAMLKEGARPDTMVAGVFGGAHMLTAASMTRFVQENILLALDFVSAKGMKVTDTHLGGKSGRKIVFDVGENRIAVEVVLKVSDIPEAVMNGVPAPFSHTGRMCVAAREQASVCPVAALVKDAIPAVRVP